MQSDNGIFPSVNFIPLGLNSPWTILGDNIFRTVAGEQSPTSYKQLLEATSQNNKKQCL
jgi:hypothetical protein